jgi:hypothetical protein
VRLGMWTALGLAAREAGIDQILLPVQTRASRP